MSLGSGLCSHRAAAPSRCAAGCSCCPWQGAGYLGHWWWEISCLEEVALGGLTHLWPTSSYEFFLNASYELKPDGVEIPLRCRLV